MMKNAVSSLFQFQFFFVFYTLLSLIFMQVTIMIFNTTLLRQQQEIADTRDGPAVLRGYQWAGGFYN